MFGEASRFVDLEASVHACREQGKSLAFRNGAGRACAEQNNEIEIITHLSMLQYRSALRATGFLRWRCIRWEVQSCNAGKDD